MNLAKTFLAHAGLENRYVIQAMRKIKMTDFVYPGDELVTKVNLKQHDDEMMVLQYRSEVAGRRVCVSEALLEAV